MAKPIEISVKTIVFAQLDSLQKQAIRASQIYMGKGVHWEVVKELAMAAQLPVDSKIPMDFVVAYNKTLIALWGTVKRNSDGNGTVSRKKWRGYIQAIKGAFVEGLGQ